MLNLLENAKKSLVAIAAAFSICESIIKINEKIDFTKTVNKKVKKSLKTKKDDDRAELYSLVTIITECYQKKPFINVGNSTHLFNALKKVTGSIKRPKILKMFKMLKLEKRKRKRKSKFEKNYCVIVIKENCLNIYL